MSDPIDRQAAYNTLTEYYHHKTDAQHIALAEALSRVPSADVPDRKVGKWGVIMDEPTITFDECKCSECGVVEYFNKGWKKFNYCPNCGARMKGED